jgi:hypothetical protein
MAEGGPRRHRDGRGLIDRVACREHAERWRGHSRMLESLREEQLIDLTRREHLPADIGAELDSFTENEPLPATID